MRRTWTIVGDVALALAAVVGALCIVVFVCGFAFGMRVVLFSTGSMTPTIPAGSAAITRELPAADISPGDVVMVDRPGKLPITHRVVSVASVPDAPASRLIVMRGDANAVDDPLPYEVDRVGLVVFSVPGIAQAISSLRSPWVLAGATVAATALVVVVCWPRRGRRPRVEAEERDAGGATAAATRTASCIALVCALVLAPAADGGQAARAAEGGDEELIEGEVIRLMSIWDESMSDLVPGAEGVWQVGVSADAAEPGVVRVMIASSGEAGLGLRYDVQSCIVRWAEDSCASARTQLLADQTVPLDGQERQLLEMADDETAWLRIAVRMPPTTSDDIDGQVDVRVRAVGMGDDVAVGGADGHALAPTGARAVWLLVPAAFAVLTAGIVLLARRRPS
ncbi:hypothetical protein GCM10009775_14390 [Microbacterium aoyamense]|uniref:Signal peptidase I n=1 Tax=Microbacterium aoyamense TaxID=344166 RepID=A0ABP5AVT6_9MICO|nr:hypothetical protein [Microbacterium aoyamense]